MPPAHPQVGGYTLPPRISVILHIYSVHRDPAVWPRPDEFIPERFMPVRRGRGEVVNGSNYVAATISIKVVRTASGGAQDGVYLRVWMKRSERGDGCRGTAGTQCRWLVVSS